MNRKLKLLLFAFLLGLVPACEEAWEYEDALIFTQPDPPIQMRFLNSLSTIPSYLYGCWDYLISPRDTILETSLDLNNDGLDDFTCTVSHHSSRCFMEGSKCDTFNYYSTLLSIEGLQEGDSIHLKDHISIPPERNFFNDQGDTIHRQSKDGYWTDSKQFLVSGGCMTFPLDHEDTYIGVKSGESLGWIHITTEEKSSRVHGITILDYAFDQRRGRTYIVAGKTEEP